MSSPSPLVPRDGDLVEALGHIHRVFERDGELYLLYLSEQINSKTSWRRLRGIVSIPIDRIIERDGKPYVGESNDH